MQLSTHPPLDLTPDVDRPLCNIECEEAIIGGILFDPNAMSRVVGLPPEAFFVAAHQHIFRAALKLHQEGSIVDMIGVIAALMDAGKLEAAGGQAKISQLGARTLGATNIDRYVAVVADKFVRRQMRQFGLTVANASGDTATDTQSLLSRAFDGLEGVRSLRPISKPKNGQELADDWFEIYSQRLSGDYQDPRLKTDFYDLDDLLGGGVRPTEQLVTILADTGCGKTTLALQIAWNIAKETTDPVIYFSLEMGKEELMDRLIALISGVEISRHSNLSEEESLKVLDAFQKVSEHPNFFIDDTAESISDVREVASTIKQEHGGMAAMLLDYVQLVKSDESTGNKVQDYDLILKELKRMTRSSKGLNTSIFILSQVTRTIRDRQNKRPTKHDGLWCSSIEQDSNIVMSVYRDEVYNPETTERGVAEVAVLKNRSAPTGMVKLLYEPHRFRFVNMFGAGPRNHALPPA